MTGVQMSKYSKITTEAELDKALQELHKEVKVSGRRLSHRYSSFSRTVSPISTVAGFFGRSRTPDFLSGLAVAISLVRKLKGKKKRV